VQQGGGGSPDEARLEQTPYPFQPTNLALFGHKITLYRVNQGFIAGGSNRSRGLSPLWPPHFNHWFVCWYIGPKLRTERPRKTKIGTEVAHVTHDSDTTFKVKKVKDQDHQAALLTAALTRQAAAAVSVGTHWAWETTATLRCARRR